jgi:hypothetical protein
VAPIGRKCGHAVGPHLDELIEYCYRRGWPLLSVIVANKPNVRTGELEPDPLRGFVAGSRAAGIPDIDDRAFLKAQQLKVFEWARSPVPHEWPRSLWPVAWTELYVISPASLLAPGVYRPFRATRANAWAGRTRACCFQTGSSPGRSFDKRK